MVIGCAPAFPSTVVSAPRSPARLRHARDLPLERELAERDARDAELSHVPPRPPRQVAPVVQTRRTAVARQALETRKIALRRQLLPERCVLGDELLPLRLTGFQTEL